MAILSVVEKNVSRTGKQDLEATSVSRFFQAVSDDPEDTALDVLVQGPDFGLPAVGEDFPDTPQLWCINVTPSIETDDGLVWTIKADYALKPPIPPEENDPQDPTNWAPVISFGFMTLQQVFERCYSIQETISAAGSGNVDRASPQEPVQNSANQDFDPPLTTERSLTIIAIQRNIKHTDFDPDDIIKFQDTVNNAERTIAGVTVPALQGWIRDYKAQKNFDKDNVAFWSQTIEVVINDQTWVRFVLDRGLEEIDDAGGTPTSPGNLVKYKRVLDNDDKPIRMPVNFDLNGKRAGGGDPKYLEFHEKWEADWDDAGLNLPEDY